MILNYTGNAGHIIHPATGGNVLARLVCLFVKGTLYSLLDWNFTKLEQIREAL